MRLKAKNPCKLAKIILPKPSKWVLPMGFACFGTPPNRDVTPGFVRSKAWYVDAYFFLKPDAQCMGILRVYLHLPSIFCLANI